MRITYVASDPVAVFNTNCRRWVFMVGNDEDLPSYKKSLEGNVTRMDIVENISHKFNGTSMSISKKLYSESHNPVI
jgi:hypothetical protein